MIRNRSILAVVMLALSVVVCAQVASTGSGTGSGTAPKTEQPTIGTIDGKVVNESGQPLAGAMVFVRTVNLGNARSTITDLEGNFRVNGLQTGLYLITANSPAYTNVLGDPDAPKYYRLGDSANVEMVRGGAITGTVTNATGEPLIGVRVRATMVRDVKGQPGRSLGNIEQPTDDRGIYRIYGLSPGTYIVSAGGSSFTTSLSAFETDIPTFAPSSTRDTAAEFSVRSGEDVLADIRYRGEPGHSISGSVKVLGTSNVSIALRRPGSTIPIATTFQLPGSRGFIVNGLADGDYYVMAQETIVSQTATPQVTLTFSEPRKVTVKG